MSKTTCFIVFFTLTRDHGLRPWSRTPSEHKKILEIKGFLGLARPFLDLVSQTPRPRGRGRPLFAEFLGFYHPFQK